MWLIVPLLQIKFTQTAIYVTKNRPTKALFDVISPMTDTDQTISTVNSPLFNVGS
jgi:hypothetical protein